MSSAPHVDRFKGTSWEECDDFISAIRARALWEGKQRDSAWIADFAAPLFTRKALSWHCQLPQDVRQDWFKLEIALVHRWPPPEDDDHPDIRPTPAAAPPVNRSDEADRQLQGVLKVVFDGQDLTYYVGVDGTLCNVTANANEAIRVRCNFVSGTTLLERIDDPFHPWLGVEWTSKEPEIKKGSTDYAYMLLVNRDTLKSDLDSGNPLQPIKFTVMTNGGIVPVWVKEDSGQITLSAFVSDTCLYMATDSEVYAEEYPTEIKGRFLIELTD